MKISKDIPYPKAINSKIVKDASLLNKILEIKPKKYHLAYRGSDNKFKIDEFYKKYAI